MSNRRKKNERRGNDAMQDSLVKCNRRARPDRRLSNIQVEWIPIKHINIRPVTRLVIAKA